MQRLTVCALIFSLAGCNTYRPEAPPLGVQIGNGGYATIAPDQTRLSNPIVETNKSVLEYAQDLDRCKARVTTKMGGEEKDDLAAIRRALEKGPLGNEMSVRYEQADAAVARDKLVKDCLRKQGYLVVR